MPESSTTYVNAYAVTRHYGGPEEGGWWYNYYQPLASVPCQVKDSQQHIDRLKEHFKEVSEGDIYSVLGGVALEVYTEDEYAKAYPTEKPYYE